MLHKLVCATVVSVPFVQDILRNLVKALIDIHVQLEKLVHYLCVDLGVFVVHLGFSNVVQVVWKVGLVPWVVLNFL